MSDRIEGNGGVGPNASEGIPATSSPPPGGRRPLGALFASTLESARTLARKHVELARIEMTEAMATRAKGAGMMAAAAVFGLFGLGFVAASGSSVLDLVLPTWAAQLIVAGVFVLLAGVLVLVGRGAMREGPTAPVRTQETLKEDARWAKQQLAR
ncbi:MAG TPA: phage holin family protein [Actinomycetota bacterium]